MANEIPFDIHASFFNDDSDETFDEHALNHYRDEIIAQFERSTEAVSLAATGQELHWARTFVEFIIQYEGVGLPSLDSEKFEGVIFRLIPRKVSVEASEAPAIISELRAFWAFLGRVYLLDNAPRFVAALDDAAAVRLEQEMANPENYGPGKSMFMQGLMRGFDMSTEEGIQTWFSEYNRELGFAPPLNYSSSASSSKLGATTMKQRSEKDRNRSRIARASRKRNGRK
jgi:hypothetical protein